ncbi:MAG: serine/threonine protein kinase [Anaerolineae bacterium]|nr:serine/threonine protein kinase [Anaerolineae bacterium]
MTDSMMGRTLEHYRIDNLLGQGGMGSVYLATDLNLRREVALKVMHPHLAARAEFQQRFFQEARAAARLDHPNIIQVYDSSFSEGQLFLVMEFVRGGSVRDYLKHLYAEKKYIDLAEAVDLTRQVAEALHYAHEQGMVHRDIKPDNVLLKPASSGGATGEFRALLTDFGLAKLAEGGVQSITGQPLGTLPYMSPEQCLAEEIDARSDIYSLGIMLYELAVGQLPYTPGTITEAIRLHTREPLPPPSQFRPGLPPALESALMNSLAKAPAARFQTAREMAAALRGVEEALASGALTLPETPLTHVDSLNTYLMSRPIPEAMPPHTYQPVTPGQAGVDRLVITAEGRARACSRLRRA